MAKLLFVVVFVAFVVAAVADLSIYIDSVQTPFQDYSYATTRNPSDSTEAHTGSDSYSFLPNVYQAVYFEDASAFDTTLYSGVQFWVYVPTGGNTNIEVDIIKSGSAVSPNKQLSTYLVSSSTITFGTWLEGFFNFSLLTSGKYDGVWWQDKSGLNHTVKFYIDDVKLVALSSGSSAAATTASTSSATSTATHATTSTSSSTSTSTHATTSTSTSSSTTSSSTSTTAKSATSTAASTASSSTTGSSASGPSDSAVQAFYSTGVASTQATYYGVYSSGGTCTLDPTPPAGSSSSIYTTIALATNDFLSSLTCGMCLEVTYSGSGSGANPPPTTPFTVYVNNLCPSCVNDGIDLGLSGDGAWDISWKAVACPVTTNIQYLFQGSNAYYIKLQVRNTKYPVYQLAIKQSGSFVQLSRTADNFFTAPSSLTFPLTYPITVQITATNGEQVTDTIAALGTSVIQGSVQFS